MAADHLGHLDVLWNSFSNSSSVSKCTYKNKTKHPLNLLFRKHTLFQQSQLTGEKFQQKLLVTGKNKDYVHVHLGGH